MINMPEKKKEKKIKKIETPEGMKTVLEILVESHNEVLNNFVRLTTDAEFIQYLVIAEPENKQHVENKINIDRNLKAKKKLLQILRKRIINNLKGKVEDGKN